MSNYEERLAASQALIEAELADEVAAASAAVSGRGSDTCLDCGSPISPERRAAAPFAVRCVECQAQHEHERWSR